MAVPRFGRHSIRDELSAAAPEAEVLGTVKEDVTDPTPQGPSTAWTGAGGPTELSEPPPPWELEDPKFAASDALRFVEVPTSWSLRWINPRLLESMGWRYWQPVMASDPRVTVKVPTMVGPDNNIRRGGHVGDILAWMPTSWVLSRRKIHQKETDLLTQSAVDRQQTLKEEFKRGTYGPYVQLTDATHPTHTIADGRTMKD